MTQDDRMETITDPAEIRASDEPDERTTPAPVGAAVALDLEPEREAGELDAGGLRHLLGLRSEALARVAARAESAEAEVVTLRAQVKGLHEELLRGDPDVVTLRARLAAVEALADQWADRKRSDGMSGNAWIGLTLSGVAADLRAALATTGEGQR